MPGTQLVQNKGALYTGVKRQIMITSREWGEKRLDEIEHVMSLLEMEGRGGGDLSPL